jgi:hypothetical protein
VIAAVWMRPGAEPAPGGPAPAIAGGSQEADAEPTGAHCKVILGLMAVVAAGTVFFGIIPSPLVDWANAAGAAIGNLLG